uniref:Protein sleepless n=1 Tax=Lygus hesperus TaxID=30085 RepID=A0A0K8T9R8_LYGHE
MERTSAIAIASLAIFIAASIQPGSALKCYECNSHNDSRCAQEVPPATLEKDCSTHQNEAKKYVLCRKIVQTIEYEVNGLIPDTRVIRSCGWDDSTHKNACYQRSGFGGRQEVCACTTDLCNSSPTLYVTSVTILAALALTLKGLL